MKEPERVLQGDGSVALVFAEHRISMVFQDFMRDSRGYEAKCQVFVNGRLVEFVRLDLLDQQRRYFVADKLPRLPDWSWQEAFVVAARSIKGYFGGDEELLDLDNLPIEGLPMPLIDPLVQSTITVWAGQGGSYKSLFSLLAAHQIRSGLEILGKSYLPPVNVAVLDYEEITYNFARQRLAEIARSYPAPPGSMKFWYRPEQMPITRTAQTLRRVLDKHDIGFVVIDSLTLARGGAPESAADTALAFEAIKHLNRPVLVLDHLKHDDGKGGGQDRPFGSVFTRNFARSLFTVKKDPDNGQRVSFTDRKANHREQGGQIDYSIYFDRDGIRATPSGFGRRTVPLRLNEKEDLQSAMDLFN